MLGQSPRGQTYPIGPVNFIPHLLHVGASSSIGHWGIGANGGDGGRFGHGKYGPVFFLISSLSRSLALRIISNCSAISASTSCIITLRPNWRRGLDFNQRSQLLQGCTYSLCHRAKFFKIGVLHRNRTGITRVAASRITILPTGHFE